MGYRITPQPVLLACLALAPLAAFVPDVSLAAPTAAVVRHYDIAAGTLDQVLNRYASTAGVLLTIDSTLTAGRRRPPKTTIYSRSAIAQA